MAANAHEILEAVEVATVGTHPSFPYAGTDIVLRSCDGIEFNVHSSLLEMISPIFRDMFQIPMDVFEMTDGTQNRNPIQMAETEEQLAFMLEAAYPYVIGRPNEDADIFFLWEMVEIADKFLMDHFMEYLREKLSVALTKGAKSTITPEFEAAVVAAYVEATKRGWWKEARQWSTLTLGFNITKQYLYGHLQRADDKFVLALLTLHRERRDAIVKALMRINFAADINYCPPGMNEYSVFWPAGEILAGIEMVHVLPACDGDHDFHLCPHKWAAFVIGLASGSIPLNPGLHSPVWNSVWDMEVSNGHLIMTLRELISRAGLALPRVVEM